MTGNVNITQPMDLGVSIFDNISTGIFFTFISPTGIRPTGLCVKISKDEMYDFTRRTKHVVTDDMKLADIQIMTINMMASPDYGPSLKKSYDDKFIRTKTLEFPGEDAKSEKDCSE